MNVASPDLERRTGPADSPGPGERALLRTLLYYRMFRFPLRREELRALSGFAWDDNAFAAATAALLGSGLATETAGYLHLDDAAQVEEREAGMRRAEQAQARAHARARLIARFPFVRGVCLSGSISKGVLGEDDDVDFFVITAPGRVWLCRTLLMAFKKLVLLNSHRYFCVNYLVAADHLEIPDQNLFTSTEIAWLRPVTGSRSYDAFVAANPWVARHLPNWQPRPAAAEADVLGQGVLGRLLERVLGGRGGHFLDDLLRRLIARRNQRRYAHLGAAVEVALRSEKHASKHHPRHFQQRVLSGLAAAVADFEARHGLSLEPGA